jgi:ferredoxin
MGGVMSGGDPARDTRTIIVAAPGPVSNQLLDGYNLAGGPRLKAMTLRVTVDPDLCIGSAECNRIAPTGFLVDDDAGVSIPLPSALDTPLERLVEAARSCPTNAIAVLHPDPGIVRDPAG